MLFVPFRPAAKIEDGATTLHEAASYVEIKYANKTDHFRSISSASGIPVEEMVFFDDQQGNIDDVSNIGVVSVLTPKGVEMKHFEEALTRYAAARA